MKNKTVLSNIFSKKKPIRTGILGYPAEPESFWDSRQCTKRAESILPESKGPKTNGGKDENCCD